MASRPPAPSGEAHEHRLGETLTPGPLSFGLAAGDDQLVATRRRRRGPRTLVVAVLGSGVLAAGTFWAGTMVRTREVTVPRKILEPVATVPVQHRRLVDLIDVEGKVMRRRGAAVMAPAPELPAGTLPLITRQPIRVGQPLQEGSVVAEIAGRPVFVLAGEIPMYRVLTQGDSGRDVAQLQQALGRIGLPVGDAPGSFGAGTARAVTSLFHEHGYYLDGPGSRPAARAKRGGVTLAPSSVVFVRELPAVVSWVGTHVGGRMPRELLRLSEGAPVVRVLLSPSQADGVPRAARVEVRSGDAVRGGRVIGRARATGGGDRIALTITLDRRWTAPLNRSVSVRIVRAGTKRPVWVVPFPAVGTASDGSSFVTVVRGARRVRVPVTLGMTARGYVAVDAAGRARLHPGDVVDADG